MQHPLPARREATPNGVIDTLTAGYAAVNRRLWILLLPIAVDLLLWLGPQVSFSPLLDPLLLRGSLMVQQIDTPRRGPRVRSADAAPPTLTSQVETLRQNIMARTNETNAFTLMARGPFALPSAMTTLQGRGDFSFARNWVEGLALLLSSLGGGLLLGAVYRVVLAAQVRGSSVLEARRRLFPDVARALGLVAVVLGAGALLGVPLLLLVGSTALIAPGIATLGLLGVLLAALFVQVYLFFAVDAIFVSGVGPLAAIQRSVAVVRRSLGPTLGLILLTWLILTGMERVWEVAGTTFAAPYGSLVGILGNAYIASGLVAASMTFYKVRADVALEQVQPAPSAQGA